MIDDHDECEWMNVSSGTGSPGLSRRPGQNPKRHKMVLCVCVCVCARVLSVTAEPC